MFDDLTIAPASSSEIAARLALAVACAATMMALAVSPAIAANDAAHDKQGCSTVSAQAATFARIQMGVSKTC